MYIPMFKNYLMFCVNFYVRLEEKKCSICVEMLVCFQTNTLAEAKRFHLM